MASTPGIITAHALIMELWDANNLPFEKLIGCGMILGCDWMIDGAPCELAIISVLAAVEDAALIKSSRLGTNPDENFLSSVSRQ